MFKIKIKAGDKKIIYKNLSVSVKYVIDEKKLGQTVQNLERVFNVHFSELQKKTFLSETCFEMSVEKPEGKPDTMIISKIKLDEKFTVDHFRNHLAGLIQKLENSALKNLHIFIPAYSSFKEYFDSEEYFYQTFVEGIHYGNYKFDQYKTDKKARPELNIFLYASNPKKLKSAISRGDAIMDAVSFAKNLQNEPGVKVYPESLAQIVSGALRKEKINVRVFDDKEIARKKMGGLLAVGKGSDHPPRFIVAHYLPLSGKSGKRKNSIKRVAIVGKGITFDSGGISLKPAAKMGEMKADMSGAAAVAGTLLAASKLKLPVEIFGIIPSAENMPSGKSMKPGDIVMTSSGKTIEIDDTDAEGRVILSDALHYASKLKPDEIIDLATLTGACVVALGEFAAGLFTKNDKLADGLYKSGIKTFDRVWRLPLWDDYHSLNKSNVADVKNLGGRWGGAITAAKFLENFVDKKIPWAHLDIAGPAFPSELNNYTKTYMTGFGVRLLIEYLSDR
jgi:leucyl aminopeptidase